MFTDDGGLTWSNPVNLTNDAAQDFKESTYPTAYPDANGKVHVQWQRDEEPGHAYETTPDPAVNNEIVYRAFAYTDFEELPPVADFSYQVSGGHVQFTDLSERAAGWDWDFGDLGTSTDQNADHNYSANGTYNVCLDVTNPYGSDQHCESVTITAAGIDAVGGNNVILFPNPTAGNVLIAFDNANIRSADIMVLNSLGQQVLLQSHTDVPELLSLNLSSLQAGPYTVHVTYPGGHLSAQVTVH
jgi:PKD repeat protein